MTLLCVWAEPVKAEEPVSPPTLTPIRHLVILYDENISFDHYFGAYPKA
ncbi:Phosphoesterase domain protein, partial [mine drainage metagenome]